MAAPRSGQPPGHRLRPARPAGPCLPGRHERRRDGMHGHRL